MTQIYKKAVLSKGIMVDVETSGPTPAKYSLLSIGAVVISNPECRFYIELKPDSMNYVQASLDVCKLDLNVLLETGTEAKEALVKFSSWVISQKAKPLFVAHNAPFDWMFVAMYLDKYSLPNHFGYWPFDTKSAYGSIMHSRLPHHAGEDAYIQTHDLLRYYAKGTAG